MTTKIIAETGASHCKSYAKCIALIYASKKAGADAIKFSAFRPEDMTVNSQDPPFVIPDGPWRGRSLYSLYEESSLLYEWLPDLKWASQAAGLEFILSIYHPDSVYILDELGIKTVKIASFELNWPEFLYEIAKSKVRNIIASTGSATTDEIQVAVDILSEKNLTLLHCISSYPARPESMNLRTMSNLSHRFNVPSGLSDHTTGLTAPVAAVTLGAEIIEKHIKIDEAGLDSSFAVLPDQFYAMVQVCRQTEQILGEIKYDNPKTYHRKNVDGQMVRVVW